VLLVDTVVLELNVRKMKKVLILSFLSIINIVCFSQTTKLWITAKANAGTQ